MKRVFFAAILQLCSAAYSQTDSLTHFKNEISVNLGLFYSGFGVHYAYWDKPRHFYLAGIDINTLGTPRTNSENSYFRTDSLLHAVHNTTMTTSWGINIGTGYKINSGKPSVLLAFGVAAGRSTLTSWYNDKVFSQDIDSAYKPRNELSNKVLETKGTYAGVFGSVTFLADLSRSVKAFATVNMTLNYRFYSNYIPISDEFDFRQSTILGVRYYF